MKKWSRSLKRAREEHWKINLAIVAANNHYGGFGPGTAKHIQEKMSDLSEVTCKEDVQVSKTEDVLPSNTKQTSLSFFELAQDLMV